MFCIVDFFETMIMTVLNPFPGIQQSRKGLKIWILCIQLRDWQLIRRQIMQEHLRKQGPVAMFSSKHQVASLHVKNNICGQERNRVPVDLNKVNALVWPHQDRAGAGAPWWGTCLECTGSWVQFSSQRPNIDASHMWLPTLYSALTKSKNWCPY